MTILTYFRKFKEIRQRKKEEELRLKTLKQMNLIVEFQHSMDRIRENIMLYNILNKTDKDLNKVLHSFFWSLEYLNEMNHVKYDPFDVDEKCKSFEEKKQKNIEFATDNYLLNEAKYILKGTKISILKRIVKSDILNDYKIRYSVQNDEIDEKLSIIDKSTNFLVKYYDLINE